MNSPKKGYSNGPDGQLHWRLYNAQSQTRSPMLLCLHPAPFSGLAFQNIAPHLAKRRQVLAPDYPGYGGSDPCAGTPSIDKYAIAMASLLNEFETAGKVDLLGFHTGCLVAAEMARQNPQSIGKLCLIDAPAFPADQSAEMAKKFGAPMALSGDINCLEAPWNMGFKSRLETQDKDQAIRLFAEEIRAGREINAAFFAAFTYPWIERMPDVSTPTMVLATQSSLLDGSRVLANTIPGAELLERLDVTKSVLDQSAETIAHDIIAYLDRA